MRHGYFGKKLSRNTNERRRLLMVLARQLIRYGSIETSLTKAKAVQPMVEKLITKAKAGTHVSQQQMMKNLADPSSVQTLLSWAPTRFANRNSGFTRIIKLGTRLGDGTEKVALSFVDPAPIVTPQTALEKKESKKEVKAAKPRERKSKAIKPKRTVKKTSAKKAKKSGK